MATEVLVPPLGQTVDTVTLVSWYKAEGEPVAQGEMLFAIETDKATLDIEAPASGVLCRVTAQSGDEVQVLTAIAHIAETNEVLGETMPTLSPGPALSSSASLTVDSVEGPAEGPVLSPALSEVEGPAEGSVSKKGELILAATQGGGDGRGRGERPRLFISPRARRLAEDQGVPLEALQATGPEGAIVERDVRTYLEAEGAPASAPSAQVTLYAEADATALVDLRGRLAQGGVEAAYTDLLLFILGRALRDHPQLNAPLRGDATEVRRGIHVGLAVDTDRGLLAPMVRDVDRKGLLQLAGETRSLIERARDGQCTPEELGGGTFTLANPGAYGIDSFTPVLDLPESAILGVGRIKAQPAGGARQGVWLSLTFDRRLVDGALAARFLRRVVQLIEQPYLLLS